MQRTCDTRSTCISTFTRRYLTHHLPGIQPPKSCACSQDLCLSHPDVGGGEYSVSGISASGSTLRSSGHRCSNTSVVFQCSCDTVGLLLVQIVRGDICRRSLLLPPVLIPIALLKLTRTSSQCSRKTLRSALRTLSGVSGVYSVCACFLLMRHVARLQLSSLRTPGQTTEMICVISLT